LAEIKVCVDPGLENRIENYLNEVGIAPVVDGLDESSEFNPRSLLVDKKLDEFPPSNKQFHSKSIMWAPPCQNWNPWRFILKIFFLIYI
jgi:hypothetical protein